MKHICPGPFFIRVGFSKEDSVNGECRQVWLPVEADERKDDDIDRKTPDAPNGPVEEAEG